MFTLKKVKQRGFTIIELLIVIVVIGILATLVLTTYNGIQAKARDTKRKTDLNALQGQIEAFDAQNGKYPIVSSTGGINDPAFRALNMKGLDPKALQDPKWDTTNTHCTASGAAILEGTAPPDAGCYSYVAAPSGCNDAGVDCTGYTLTASLEDGTSATKTNLN